MIWSKSKDYNMCFCLRKYYYTYILNFEDSPDEHKIFELRKLKNRFLIKTDVIKFIIKKIIDDKTYGFEYGIEYYNKILFKSLNDFFDNRICFENYYNKNFDKNMFYIECETLLKNFFKSNLLKLIHDESVKEIVVTEEEFEENYVNLWDYKIYGFPDLIMKTQTDIIGINFGLSKKNNNNEICFEEKVQGFISKKFLEQHLVFDHKKELKNACYNLYNNIIKEIEIDCETETLILNYIKKSLNRLLFIENNNFEYFNKTSNLDKCKYCNFNEVCNEN